MAQFAFYGRVSTEDLQDPASSRGWQLSRSRSLIAAHGGVIVAEYFDIGLSRSLPWKRRPQAAALLADLKKPDRGFNAVVIGEPARAFYGNQFGLTFPVFVHYGVQLWVPEVGGAVDPGSDAHDLVMTLYGGMSKGERNRIKIRVRTAMASQASTEGRFLGGRPPYGYQLADAGHHPNPGQGGHRTTAAPARDGFGRRPGCPAHLRGLPRRQRHLRDRRATYSGRHPVPVRARPGPQPAPQRRSLVQGRGPGDPAQPPLHR